MKFGKKPKNPIVKRILSYLAIILGAAMVGFAISVFYTPNKIVSGGVSGIATILYHILGIDTAVSYLVINIALLLIALFFIGKEFVINTIGGTLLVTLFVEVFSYIPPVTDDVFLASVFGAGFYGIGIGLALINGASTGGTDIIGRLVQKAVPHARIGTLLLAIDFLVIAASFVSFENIDLALYGIIALAIDSVAINWLISKLNISKLTFVVTDKGAEMGDYLVHHSPRGVTLIEAKGCYTNTGKQVLLCALKESEVEKFQKRVLDIDPNAFVIFSESSQIVGNGFRVYK